MILCEAGEIDFLFEYDVLVWLAIVAKSSCRIRFIENVLVHELVITLIVLIPLDHFLVREMTN
ncbi:MAG: hypothetical protein WCJ45_05315 [bacterium]